MANANSDGLSDMSVLEPPVDWSIFTKESYKPFVIDIRGELVRTAEWGTRETWKQCRHRWQSCGVWVQVYRQRDAFKVNGETKAQADERVRKLYPPPWGYVEPREKDMRSRPKWGDGHPQVLKGKKRIREAFDNAISSADLSKDDFKGKPKCDEAKAIRWVADNIAFSDVNLRDAPSGFAADMLKWARASADNKREFYLNVLPKVLPTRGKGDDTNTFEDDGRMIDGLVEKVLKSGEVEE